MRTPTNIRPTAYDDRIEIEWDRPPTHHFEYEIIRYQDHPSLDATSILKTTLSLEASGLRVKYVDSEDLESGAVYFYTICYLDPGKLLFPLKSVRVRYAPAPPAPLIQPSVSPMSNRRIAISWQDYTGDLETEVDAYEVYVEAHNFFNVAGKTAALIAHNKSCIYELPGAVDRLFIAVVPVNKYGQKVLSVNTTMVIDPWKDVLTRSFVNFSLSPVSQFEHEELIVEIVNGEPFSSYSILVGDHLLPNKVHTDLNGSGKLKTQVPPVGPGRHGIHLDNGAGSTTTSDNYFLVPVKLSPIENDVVPVAVGTDLHSGFDTSIIDRVRFSTQNQAGDTVSFRFKKGKTLLDLKLNICNILTQFKKGAISTSDGDLSARTNVFTRLLPSFSYPPFVFNPSTGSLNLFGIVQTPGFSTAHEWAIQINELHEYEGGLSRVITSISRFDIESQKFGEALVDTGSSYEGDFSVGPGESFLVEVKEPINNYAISGDGLSTFSYLPLMNAPVGGLHAIVLVADGSYTGAADWANDINTQHELVSLEPRVVTSITRWSSSSQSYGLSLVDTGTGYEGNFNLVPGQGYIVELKEPVSNYVLSGTALTEDHCP